MTPRPVTVGYDMTPASAQQGGVGRYTTDLAAALGRRTDVRLERLAPGHPPLPGALGGVTRRAARARYYPFTLDRLAVRRGVDLVHCPGEVAPLRLSRPLVLTVHDVLPWRFPELFSRTNAARQKLLVSRAARRASRIMVGSEYTRREVVELLGVEPGRVAVAPLGVDRRFRRIDADPVALAHRFGIPPGPFALWVGNPEPRKNLSTLLRAFALVRRRAPECSLVLVGSERVADRETERELDLLGSTVIRPGFVTDEELVALYSATTCFVFPSLYEGFGLPPLEAMACGAPVVAADRTSVPEVVGDAAVLVDPSDPDALADAIERVVLSPETATHLRRVGQQRAREFTWDRCAERTVDAYRAALADPR
jgi:glycosyltransferase involved in cell wall biosynthesis